MKIAITGATGYIGTHICSSFDNSLIDFVRLIRQPTKQNDRFYDLTSHNIDPYLFDVIDVLIHAAAYVHKDNDKKKHKELNFESTKILFDLAAKNNVNIIFLSTVGVYGKVSNKTIIDESEKAMPLNEYSKAKLDCENYLHLKFIESNIKYTIFRLPLVIGKNAPGTFGVLEKLVLLGFPLPFKNINNLRSVICVNRFSNYIAEFCNENSFFNKSFIVKNKNDISLDQMIDFICNVNKTKIKKFYFPIFLLKTSFKIIGKKKQAQQLFDSLRFNASIEI